PSAVVAPSVVVPEPAKKPWKHELEDLYSSDFNLLSMQRELESKTFNTQDDPTPITIKMRFRIYQDFNSGTDFVSVFIAISHNIKIDEKIYGAIRVLRDQIQFQYDDLKKSVGT